MPSLLQAQLARLHPRPSQKASQVQNVQDDAYRDAWTSLSSLNPDAFAPFAESLFRPSLKAQDPLLLSTEDRASLNLAVANFLTLLSPYFALDSARLCIQYLVKSFRINRLNVQDLIACSLPWSETRPFVDLVASLDLSYVSSFPWSS